MTTFSIFLFFIATPVLIGIVVIMVIIAKKASKFENLTHKHIKIEDERFEIKKQELKGIDNKVDSLSDIVSNKVINPLADVSNRINLLGVDANMENFKKSLNELDISFSEIGESSVFFEIEFGDLPITFIANLDLERELVYFQAFYGALNSISSAVYEYINSFNSTNLVGNLELRTFSDKYVPTLNYALLLHGNKLSRNNILKTIKYLSHALKELFTEKVIIELSFYTISFQDFLKLSIGEEEFKKLTSSEEKVGEDTKQE